MRTLIVEDDPLLADGLAQLLRGAGFTADYVGSAELAEAALAAEKFDLMILDIGLPGMDGLELAETVKARRPWTPVVIVTGFVVDDAVVVLETACWFESSLGHKEKSCT